VVCHRGAQTFREEASERCEEELAEGSAQGLQRQARQGKGVHLQHLRGSDLFKRSKRTRSRRRK